MTPGVLGYWAYFGRLIVMRSATQRNSTLSGTLDYSSPDKQDISINRAVLMTTRDTADDATDGRRQIPAETFAPG